MTKKTKHQKEDKQFEKVAEALVNAIDAKDKYTNGHSRRVANYSKKIAKELGKSEDECEKVYFAALLHDVGKIGIPIEILTKENGLTEEEFESIKRHPDMGGQILSSIKKSPWLEKGAKYHHERYDGTGYPEGRKGKEIPEIARIISVADAYDAMTSNRSYRNAIPQHIVREEFVKGMGAQFDPDFAKIMIHLIDLDIEYKMKERITGSNLSTLDLIHCNSIYDGCTEGIGITKKKTKIQFYSHPDSGFSKSESMPTLIVFDSLDGQVHPGEENNKDLLYHEYARIRIDGQVTELGVRKSKVIMNNKTDLGSSFDEPLQDKRYKVVAVRNRDHLLVRISTQSKMFDVILALPDTSRYVYISISGEHCEIHNVAVDTNSVDTIPNYIPRIAEEIRYTKDCPVGDIPNVEIDGPRMATSEGIPVNSDMTIKFHTMSYETARLVWHCPYLCLYSSSNGQVDGDKFREFLLLKMDGENWESFENVDNQVKVKQMEDFENWDSWIESNKSGIDCMVNIKRKDNKIIMQTQNLGVAISSITTIQDDTEDVYLAITGDQCAITNIKVKEVLRA